MATQLFNHLWQSTLFAAVTGLLTFALRKNRARVRHALWFAASLKFLIPFSALIVLGTQVEWRKTSKPAPMNFALVMDQVSEPFLTSADSTPLFATIPASRATAPWLMILLTMWAVGFLGIATSWIIRWRRIHSVVRSGLPIQLALPIRAIASPTLLEPGVFGIVRPVLLLPEGIVDRLTPAQLQSVIEHELCHVRHRDNLVATIQMFIETIFWFHPLVWWIGKRMLAERERACDEAVVSMGSEPHVYAEAILNVCKLYVESPLVCVAGVTGAGLKQRIQAIVAGRTGRQLNRAQRALLAAAAVITVLLPVAIGVMNARPAFAQPQAAAAGPIPKWEVVSIKPCDSNAPTARSNDPNGRGPGRLTLSCQTVRNLLGAYAFYSNGSRPSFARVEFEGAPPWIDSERYFIEAKAETPQGRFMMRGPMMQKLLEDRFKLKIRKEIREVPVYNLMVARGGTKHMRPSKPGGCVDLNLDGAGPPPEPNDKIHLCEMIGRGLAADGSGHMEGFGFTMPRFAEQLSALLDRNVIDKTGLSGTFDIEAPVAIEDLTSPKENDPDHPFRDDEMIRGGIRQMGLRLESAKGPSTVYVIDHVERPTDNFTPPPPQADAAPRAALNVAAKPQRSAPPIEDKPLRFDAASIKPRNPVGGRGNGVSAVPRAGRGAGVLLFTPGRVAGVVINAVTLIKEAYRVKDYQLAGLPTWAQSERFDFEGKAEDAATEPQLRQMLQTFLAERFGLAMHREPKEMVVLAMTVGKDGMKAPALDAPDPKPDDNDHQKHMIARGTPEALADTLSSIPLTGRPVIDRTGLTGRYKFLVGWDDDEDFLPSVAREFGLRFETQKAMVDVLVIDRIQKPEAN